MSEAAYLEFHRQTKDIHTVWTIEAILDWDQQTNMPRRGAADRADQLALVAGMAHERLASDEFGRALEAAETATNGANHVYTTNLREMRRRRDRAVKVPTALVKEIAKTASLAQEVWATARRDSHFPTFAPYLDKMLDLKRQVAAAVGWDTEPYDALMDEYEPDAKAAAVQSVFDRLKADLVPLVAEIGKAPRQPDASILQRSCPVEQQKALNRKLAEVIGFDFDAGRIDVSTHPFCSGHGPHDVRLTTRYDEHLMPMSLFGTLHEAGHGLYEQGLDPEHTSTPMGSAVSLGIHESQSRLWENQVGRGRAFWEHNYAALQAAFPSLADVSLDDFTFAINTVRPSFIRVEADEVTYCLHIMLRFDLERQMVAGKLKVADIPDAWNAGMQDLLGITPPDDARGCLQDIHWSIGIFGYFPTYALGTLYSAQFFAKAREALGDLDAMFRKGEYTPLLTWLRENIHRHGKRYPPHELVKVVTGAELSHEPFVDYLNAKFRPLYGI